MSYKVLLYFYLHINIYLHKQFIEVYSRPLCYTAECAKTKRKGL